MTKKITEVEEIKCPECGSKELRFNALHDYFPIEDQFIYTCAKCQNQFNVDEKQGTENDNKFSE